MKEEYIIIAVILLIVIIYVYVKLRMPIIKGKIGEKRVSAILSRLNKDKYIVYNDIYVGSSQIDHVVVSRYGVFVIETKYYKGWIFGSDNAQYWRQSLCGSQFYIYNPIVQNSGHVKQLMNFLRLPRKYFIPVVVLAGSGTLKFYSENNVVYASQLRNFIKKHDDRILSQDIVDRLTRKMSSPECKNTKEAARLHIRVAKKAIKESHRREKAGMCPRCGGNLVLRSSQYGQFYGCSNYPRCTYTAQIQRNGH